MTDALRDAEAAARRYLLEMLRLAENPDEADYDALLRYEAAIEKRVRAERDAEVRALVGWILEQGAHPSDCAFYGAKECDCGYERVLKPFEEAQP